MKPIIITLFREYNVAAQELKSGCGYWPASRKVHAHQLSVDTLSRECEWRDAGTDPKNPFLRVLTDEEIRRWEAQGRPRVFDGDWFSRQ